ncbi:hypothetical protein LY28_03499 [Ruminiclostridium sufflavum DSM 19573]|uniref:Uncharacterized protein n=1 Tax=Ruminiclostridium sufflavum DSM 19573 TaxID=1121337 RepID=A0A318Y1G7_9FIRM|nr:hypothetical protein [Ruminiclostridium sufflavum]PYG84878.1 hypothetical protein LY28_03499 [Ruminiclostridium sufflavum DSM 19573]
MKNSEAISQSVSARIINELKAGGYSAIAVNTSGRENNWDTEKICVIRDGKDVCDINCSTNTISYSNRHDRSEVERILALIVNLQEQEGNYINAPALKVNKLENYRLLSEYNNVILAACRASGLNPAMQKVDSIQYVTWARDSFDDGVQTGHYFSENYAAAKEDFAKRSGLINEDKLFSETELIALYDGLVKLEGIDNTNEAEKILNSVKRKISNVIPDIENKIYGRNPVFKENERYCEIDDKNAEPEEWMGEEVQENFAQ